MSDAQLSSDDTKNESSQWAPLFWVALLAYFVLLSYGLARSTIDSLLLADHGKEAMKYAYGAVAVSVTAVVYIYAKAAKNRPIGQIVAWAAALSALSLTLLLAARLLHFPCASYALYVWKDVYVIVLIELIWTLANSAFKQNTATWAYGGFCIAGTLGDMSGSFLGQEFVHQVGTASLLWFVIPVLIVIIPVGLQSARSCGWPSPPKKSGMKGVLSVIRSSRSIQLLLILVTVIQITTTLIDYNYRAISLDTYPITNDRTAAFHQVDFAISMVSMCLQFLSGAFATFLGLRFLVVLLPFLVGAAALYYAISPAFFSVALLKTVNKGLDYSLFRTSKELLYRPLSYAEKTQGKAIVDIFGYRVAKGGASALLVAFSGVAALVTMATIAGIAIWILLALLLVAHLPNGRRNHS